MSDKSEIPEPPFDPEEFGKAMRDTVRHLWRSCRDSDDQRRLESCFAMAAAMHMAISHDRDAIAFALWLGFGAGGQQHGKRLIAALHDAIEIGFEGAEKAALAACDDRDCPIHCAKTRDSVSN